jgi:aryl-alcohol dehydrogenase-like predicted oxidoreductase
MQAGRIHAIGASNWSHERIETANRYALANGLEPFVASSPQFSLAEPLNEPWPLCLSISGPAGRSAREWYTKTQMPLLIWSPLASGFFSGRFRRDNLHQFGEDGMAWCTISSGRFWRWIGRALATEKVDAAQIALASSCIIR